MAGGTDDDEKPHVTSKAEAVRTVAALVAAAGTLYLVGSRVGWW